MDLKSSGNTTYIVSANLIAPKKKLRNQIKKTKFNALNFPLFRHSPFFYFVKICCCHFIYIYIHRKLIHICEKRVRIIYTSGFHWFTFVPRRTTIIITTTAATVTTTEKKNNTLTKPLRSNYRKSVTLNNCMCMCVCGSWVESAIHKNVYNEQNFCKLQFFFQQLLSIWEWKWLTLSTQGSEKQITISRLFYDALSSNQNLCFIWKQPRNCDSHLQTLYQVTFNLIRL